MSYPLILADLVAFLMILTVGELVARAVVRRRTEPIEKPGVVDRHVRDSLHRLVRAAAVVGLSLAFDGIEELLLELDLLSTESRHLARLEQTHLGAWLLFWAVDVVINGVDFALRARARRRGRPLSVSPLMAAFIRVCLLALAAIWLARYVLGWHTTHVLVSATALTAVAAFALKGVTSDLLGGISLHTTRAILPAQWIDVPSLKIAGEVLSAGWREVRIRTTSGHVYVVPNAKLAAAPFHNMSWPDSTRRHGLDFDLCFDADPDHVEDALLAAIEGIEGVLQTPKPPQVIIRHHVDWGTRYRLRFWSQTYFDRGSFESRIYRKAWRELRRRDIRFRTLAAEIARADEPARG